MTVSNQAFRFELPLVNLTETSCLITWHNFRQEQNLAWSLCTDSKISTPSSLREAIHALVLLSGFVSSCSALLDLFNAEDLLAGTTIPGRVGNGRGGAWRCSVTTRMILH